MYPWSLVTTAEPAPSPPAPLVGVEWVVEALGCDPGRLRDPDRVRAAVKEHHLPDFIRFFSRYTVILASTDQDLKSVPETPRVGLDVDPDVEVGGYRRREPPGRIAAQRTAPGYQTHGLIVALGDRSGPALRPSPARTQWFKDAPLGPVGRACGGTE